MRLILGLGTLVVICAVVIGLLFYQHRREITRTQDLLHSVAYQHDPVMKAGYEAMLRDLEERPTFSSATTVSKELHVRTRKGITTEIFAIGIAALSSVSYGGNSSISLIHPPDDVLYESRSGTLVHHVSLPGRQADVTILDDHGEAIIVRTFTEVDATPTK